MDEEQFHKQIKDILSITKRGKYDSPTVEIHDAFHNEVVGKSSGVWDKNVAEGVMKEIEWFFNIQPEVVRQAVRVEEQDVITTLKEYLIKRGYEYSHINEGKDKTPEGYITGFGKKYLCEVKSPLLKFDHRASPYGYKFASSHRKILDFIHTAKKQFDAEDSGHKVPHILIYTSAHFQLNWKTFYDSIQGGVIDRSGKKLPDLTSTDIYQATKNMISKIDGYIWLQIASSKQFYQASYFINTNSNHKSSVGELFTNLYENKVSNSGFDNFIEF